MGEARATAALHPAHHDGQSRTPIAVGPHLAPLLDVSVRIPDSLLIEAGHGRRRIPHGGRDEMGPSGGDDAAATMRTQTRMPSQQGFAKEASRIPVPIPRWILRVVRFGWKTSILCVIAIAAAGDSWWQARGS